MAPRASRRATEAPAKPPSRKKSDVVKPAAAAKRKAVSDSKPDERIVKRRAAKPVVELEPVSHPSHGKIPGQLFVLGDGDCGQLGLGEDVTERLRPFPVDVDGQKILQVACGGMHTVVLTEEHQVYSWGVNDEGALGRPTAGELWEKSGLLPDSSAQESSGDSYTPGHVVFDSDTPIVQLSAGDSHTAALSTVGEVWAWGTFRDASGVYGFAPDTRIALQPVRVYRPKTSEEQVVRIVSGADHIVALTRAGTVLTWGTGQQGQLARIGERMGDRAKRATLLTPAPVLLRRRGKRGERPRVVDVAAAAYASFLVLDTGGVMAAGLNNYGQLGIKGDYDHMFFKLEDVKALEGWKVGSIKGGQHHTLVLATKENESAATQLLSFGRPTYGRLGQKEADVGSDGACPIPRPVDGLEGVQLAGAAAGIAVSGTYSIDGEAWLWGFGTNSQLGKGDDDSDEVLPKKLAVTKRLAGQQIIGLEFGGQHAAMLCVPKPDQDEAPKDNTSA